MRLGFILFATLPLAGQAYVMWRSWQLMPFSAIVKCLVLLLMLAAMLCFILNFVIGPERLPLQTTAWIYEIGTTWLEVMFYMVLLYGVIDLATLCRLLPRGWSHHNLWGTVFVALLMLTVFLCGNIHYNNKVRRCIELHSNGKLHRPLTVVMTSDWHLGFHNQRRELARWIDMINAENPDLVLIAGDVIDISVRPLVEQDMAQEFRRLNAPVVACLGNHEYFSGEPRAQRFFEQAGIVLLRDSVAQMGDVCIIGRDDRSNPNRRSLAEMTAAIPSGRYSIVLDHQPYQLEEAEQANVDFQLSGHTHNGQIWPLNYAVKAIYECGFGSWKLGKTDYYISSGLGIWGGKYRIGTCSEYVVATILP